MDVGLVNRHLLVYFSRAAGPTLLDQSVFYMPVPFSAQHPGPGSRLSQYLARTL